MHTRRLLCRNHTRDIWKQFNKGVTGTSVVQLITSIEKVNRNRHWFYNSIIDMQSRMIGSEDIFKWSMFECASFVPFMFLYWRYLHFVKNDAKLRLLENTTLHFYPDIVSSLGHWLHFPIRLVNIFLAMPSRCLETNKLISLHKK